MFLIDQGSVVERALIESFQLGQFLLNDVFFLIVFEGVHEMSKARQSFEGRNYVCHIAEEIVGNVKFVEFLEARKVVGKRLQAIAIEGKAL